MYVWEQAQKQISQELKKHLGQKFAVSASDLLTPPNPKMGHLAFVCFAAAKSLKRNPQELAAELVLKIKTEGLIQAVEAQGPYLNFFLDLQNFGAAVLSEILKEGKQYGRNATGQKKKVMVEYANPNTHKDVHVGHLRNFVVGQVAVNLLNENGYQTIPVSYINDLGANVAACLWGIKNLSKGKEPKKQDQMQFLSRMYVKATAQMQADPKVKEAVSKIHLELEEQKGEYLNLWKKTHKWSEDYLKSVFADFNLPIQKYYWESDLIADTKKAVQELLKKKIAKKSQGAIIVDLEKQNLGVDLLVKSDGALLYNAKDIALAVKKKKDYQAEQSIYVIDARQSLAMKQLFAVLAKMKFKQDLRHLAYDFVTLPEGAMSSRKGTVIRYEDFRDEVTALARKETKKRHKGWSAKKLDQTARSIALAAIRFSMLKQDLNKVIVFDPQEALAFDGYSGPYLLYTYARINSILKKAGQASGQPKGDDLQETVERELVMLLAQYPSVVREAGETLQLSQLVHYAFDLSKKFAEYYERVPVAQAEPEVRATRLATVKSVQQVLANVLTLLSIEPVKEM
ncbi:arginine--tRNA ligase [Patescibacteria group bacterium]|nr:arginine--tRNA ligase [Patescibacteria group bacterium]MBU1705242.1 arginine--tRNA ligase [Patescibacteria group bacterium]